MCEVSMHAFVHVCAYQVTLEDLVMLTMRQLLTSIESTKTLWLSASSMALYLNVCAKTQAVTL